MYLMIMKRTMKMIMKRTMKMIMKRRQLVLQFYCAEDEDIRVELFYALAKAECPVIEMNKLDTSLEDAFPLH